MRRSLLISFYLLFAGFAHAQYVPNSSQAFQFSSMYNPAFSGIDEFTSLKLGYGYRWAGFEGAPKSVNLSFNMRIKKPLDLTTNTLRLSNLSAVKIPKRKFSAIGFGASVFQTTYGAITTSGGIVNLAVHYPISKKVKLAFGLATVIENTKFNINPGIFREDETQTTFYQSLIANGSSKSTLNLRAGLLIYAPKFYLGFTYFPVFQTNIQTPAVDDANPDVYMGAIQTGYSIAFSPDFTVKPSITGLLISKGGANLDYNVKAYIQRSSWIGLTYRDIKSAVISLGFNVNYLLTASYSYERSFGKFSKFNGGSHELVLSLRLNNFKKQDPYTW